MNLFLIFYFIIFSIFNFKNFSKCCCCLKETDNKKINYNNNEYFLSNGLDINTPLNIEWANNNCAVLALFRFLLSDEVLLDRLVNKITSKQDNHKKEIQTLKSQGVIDNVSLLFKKFKTKKANYNEEIYDILRTIINNSITIDEKDIYRLSKILLDFIRIYFSDLFEFKFNNNNRNEGGICLFHIPLNKISSGKHKTNKYISLNYSNMSGVCEIENPRETISIKQEDNSIKEYELIGAMLECGDHINADLNKITRTDFVLILPVYDKNKKKKGYTAYQFNNKPIIKTLKEWIDVKNFNGFSDPFFSSLIYRYKE